MKTDYQIVVLSTIKKKREERGISQLALSSYLGISPGQMGNIDSFKQPHKFTLKQIKSICDYMMINIEDVFFPNEGDKHHSINDIINAIIKYQEK